MAMNFDVQEVKQGIQYKEIGIGLRTADVVIANVVDDVKDDKKNAFGNNIQLSVIVGQPGIERTRNVFIAGKFYEKDGKQNLPVIFKDFCSAIGVTRVSLEDDGSMSKSVLSEMIGKEFKLLEYRSGNYTGNDGNEYPNWVVARGFFKLNESDDKVLEKFNKNIDYLPKTKPYTPEAMVIAPTNGISENVPDNDEVPF